MKLIGHRVKLFWPEEGGWFEAVVSDYNISTDEHALVYNWNTKEESFEWIRVSNLSSHEFKHVPGPVVAVLPPGGSGAPGRTQGAPRGAGKPEGMLSPKAGVAPQLAEFEATLRKAKDPRQVEEAQAALARRQEEIQRELAMLEDSDDEQGAEEPAAEPTAEADQVMHDEPPPPPAVEPVQQPEGYPAPAEQPAGGAGFALGPSEQQHAISEEVIE
jgi:hypothetical protein